MDRIIMHIDMDYFFAQIEERENPKIKGAPVVVGANPKAGTGRGVISTCNYEARKFGLRSGMPISKAFGLCPKAVFLPVNYSLYSEVSERIMETIKGFSKRYESGGIDEIFLDLSDCGSIEKAKEIGMEIKKTILKKEKLTCSIGIAPNKLLAKIASDHQKPDGLTIVTPSSIDEFLEPKSVRSLWGIGPKTEILLNKMGIFKIRDLKKCPLERLKTALGSHGEDFYYMARGIDESEVEENGEVKSIGEQVTFEQDTGDQGLLVKTLLELSGSIYNRVKKEGFFFKTVTVTVRYKPFETHTSSHTLENYTDKLETLKAQSLGLLFAAIKTKRLIRLLGLRVSNLQFAHDEQLL